MVERFSANFSENCSKADRQWEAVGQQREVQNCASLLVQLSILFLVILLDKTVLVG